MRGGRREGAGRKKGSKNKERFELSTQPQDATSKQTPKTRMRLLKRLVCSLVADGREEGEIAAVLQMPIDKLRAIFARELQHGALLLRAEVLAGLTAEAEAGSVAALKTLSELTAGREAKDQNSYIGKKAAAKAVASAAVAAGGIFAPRPSPRIVIDNEK